MFFCEKRAEGQAAGLAERVMGLIGLVNETLQLILSAHNLPGSVYLKETEREREQMQGTEEKGVVRRPEISHWI